MHICRRELVHTKLPPLIGICILYRSNYILIYKIYARFRLKREVILGCLERPAEGAVLPFGRDF